jgi:hypothetical protein
MGGKDSGAPIQPQTDALQTDATALTQIAQQQNQTSQKLFNEAYPGFQKAEDFYSTLASGDPYAIAHATAPATQQITKAAEGAKKNILANGPAGGEKNLALEEVDVNRGAEVGKVASEGYLGSFNALAQLAQQGVGQSIATTGQAISGMEGSAQASQAGAGLQLQNQQLKDQEKGATLGSLASLGGDIAQGLGAGAAGAGGFAALFAGI